MLTTLLLLMLVPSVLGQAEEPLTLDEGLNTLQLTPDQPTSLNIPMEGWRYCHAAVVLRIV